MRYALPVLLLLLLGAAAPPYNTAPDGATPITGAPIAETPFVTVDGSTLDSATVDVSATLFEAMLMREVYGSGITCSQALSDATDDACGEGESFRVHAYECTIYFFLIFYNVASVTGACGPSI